MSSETHTASCCCGQLQATVVGDLPNAAVCHCRQCQKRTGSVFGVQARFPRERVTVTGERTAFVRRGEGEVTLYFCPACGSTVYWEIDGMPESVIIAVGAFADPQFPAPVFSVYEARQHPWVQLPESVTVHWD